MPVFIDNNNYIAWLYIRGIPEYIARARTILHLSYGRVQYGPSSIYSGIPLIAMQYNINILEYFGIFQNIPQYSRIYSHWKVVLERYCKYKKKKKCLHAIHQIKARIRPDNRGPTVDSAFSWKITKNVQGQLFICNENSTCVVYKNSLLTKINF